jgi:hypothetical protein
MMVESVRYDKWTKAQENTKYFTKTFNSFITFDNTDRIDNKEFITLVKDTKPKISHFCNTIERTLLASPQFKSKDWHELEENCWVILDNLDEELKKL